MLFVTPFNNLQIFQTLKDLQICLLFVFAYVDGLIPRQFGEAFKWKSLDIFTRILLLFFYFAIGAIISSVEKIGIHSESARLLRRKSHFIIV